MSTRRRSGGRAMTNHTDPCPRAAPPTPSQPRTSRATSRRCFGRSTSTTWAPTDWASSIWLRPPTYATRSTTSSAALRAKRMPPPPDTPWSAALLEQRRSNNFPPSDRDPPDGRLRGHPHRPGYGRPHTYRRCAPGSPPHHRLFDNDPPLPQRDSSCPASPGAGHAAEPTRRSARPAVAGAIECVIRVLRCAESVGWRWSVPTATRDFR